MKKFKAFILVGLALLMIGGEPVFAQSKKEKKEQKQKEVKEMIDSGNFTINVDRALPQGGGSRNLTSAYSLQLKGDSAYSYLPYFGRAYTAPYGGGEGLRFEEPVTDYAVKYNKKGTANIEFEVKTVEDTYKYQIDVFNNGSASIHVQPINKQSISFHGNLNTAKELADRE